MQLTTDGHKAYLNAVEGAFRNEIDYAMLLKIYGNAPQPDTRYSAAECIGCRKENVSGEPDWTPCHPFERLSGCSLIGWTRAEP